MISFPAMHWSAPAGSGGTLRTGLLAHWSLDEVSGVRADDLGGYSLTDNNGVGNTAGILGNGAAFDYTGPDFLSHAPAADLRFGSGVTREFAFWFKDLDIPNETGILGCDGATSRDYAITASNRILTFLVFDLAGTPHTISYFALGGGQHTAGVWHLGFVGFDAATQLQQMQIDAGPLLYGPDIGSTVRAGGEDFRLGMMPFYASHDMKLDEVGVWGRILTPTERTQLYNAGAGLPFSGY